MALQTSVIHVFVVVVFLCLQKANIMGGKICPQSTPTESVVETCPLDATEWIKAKERKQCHLIIHNCTGIDHFQYHCLPNKFLDKLVAVCAPLKIILGHHCPYYDIQRKTIETNFNQMCRLYNYSSPCPAAYRSNEVYRYQRCYEDIKEKANQITSKNRLFLEVSDSYQYLTIGIYMICVLFIVLVSLLIILLCCLYPCCEKYPCKRQHQLNRNKKSSETDVK